MRTPKPKVWLCRYSIGYITVQIHGLQATFRGQFDAVEDFLLQQKKNNNTITEAEKQRRSELIKMGGTLIRQWQEGEYLEPKIMPERLYRYPKDKLPKPHEQIFRIMNGFLVVTQAVYDVMKQFRLGQTHFSQVYIYDIQKPEKLLSEIPYYFINIAEKRHFVDIEHSRSLSDFPKGEADHPRYSISSVEDKDLHLFTAAKDCDVDLWHDPYLYQSLFMSDRLVQALLDSGIKKGKLALKQCVLLDN